MHLAPPFAFCAYFTSYFIAGNILSSTLQILFLLRIFDQASGSFKTKFLKRYKIRKTSELDRTLNISQSNLFPDRKEYCGSERSTRSVFHITTYMQIHSRLNSFRLSSQQFEEFRLKMKGQLVPSPLSPFNSPKSRYLGNGGQSDLPDNELVSADQTSPSTFIYADSQLVII